MNQIKLEPTKALGFHFSRDALGYKDGRKVKEGITHIAKGYKGQVLTKISGNVCEPGMHASLMPQRAFACSQFFHDISDLTTVSFVLVEGIKRKEQDSSKFVGFKRTYLRCVKLTDEQKNKLDVWKHDDIVFNDFVYSLFK